MLKRVYVWCQCGYANVVEVDPQRMGVHGFDDIVEVSCAKEAWYRELHRQSIAAANGHHVAHFVADALARLGS